MILVDTNILLDVAENDPVWADLSQQQQLELMALTETLVINPVIYAEFSIGYARIEEVEAVLDAVALRVAPMPREALFLAGKAFLQYRQRGGLRTGVLPDFLIGAHAAVEGWQLLTRDAGRYRSYFPALKLITPDAGSV
jgi:predicted nucleic acid-binding protein